MSALQAIKVLELSGGVSGEYCGKLLADFGAEVIKLEPPEGSPVRRLGARAKTCEPQDAEGSTLFAYLNTNKRSVTLDLAGAAGRDTLQRLLGRVDVVISDQPQQWLTELGLDAGAVERHWPGLVVCSITPYGHSDNSPAPARDLNVFHSSGWGYHTPSAADPASPPLKGAGGYLASYEAGLEAAMCVAAVLCERQASGLGQYIDIAQQAVLASRLDYVLGQMIAGDMNVSAERTAFDLSGPADIYPCTDGFVYIWMSAPAHWQALGTLMGQPAWMADFPEHWLERACTPERVGLCRQHLGAWLQGQLKAEVSDRAQKLGLIMVPVNNPGDLLACPQYRFRGFFQSVEHPRLGRARYPTVPYRLSATPAALTTPAPLLGQHTAELLAPATQSWSESEVNHDQ